MANCEEQLNTYSAYYILQYACREAASLRDELRLRKKSGASMRAEALLHEPETRVQKGEGLLQLSKNSRFVCLNVGVLVTNDEPCLFLVRFDGFDHFPWLSCEAGTHEVDYKFCNPHRCPLFDSLALCFSSRHSVFGRHGLHPHFPGFIMSVLNR